MVLKEGGIMLNTTLRERIQESGRSQLLKENREMLRTTPRRKKAILPVIAAVALLMLLTTTIALAATKYIDEEGGTIDIARGVSFVVPEGSLITERGNNQGVVITVHRLMFRKTVIFRFGPCGTQFSESNPAMLCVTWQALGRTEDLVLHGPDGLLIEPEVYRWGVIWRIPHFSIYYYRRR
jgi:hypothetical protein